jgi:hypothetical protein
MKRALEDFSNVYRTFSLFKYLKYRVAKRYPPLRLASALFQRPISTLHGATGAQRTAMSVLSEKSP